MRSVALSTLDGLLKSKLMRWLSAKKSSSRPERIALKRSTKSTILLITTFLGGGNVLLNDVPGVGKTTLAKAMAASIKGEFRRIQFTPDLLPADILGGSIYNPKEGSFAFRKGPIFTNVLLADERQIHQLGKAVGKVVKQVDRLRH